MLTKEDISDSIILERLYSAISTVKKCMNCNVTKPIYLDVHENILRCKKCSKNKERCKLIGIDKISNKELKNLEENIFQNLLKKKSGFSLKNLISRYLKQKTKSDKSELNDDETRIKNINFLDNKYNNIENIIDYRRRSTSDFCNLYEEINSYKNKKNFSMDNFDVKFTENINNNNNNNFYNKYNSQNNYIRSNFSSKNPFDFF